LVQCNAAEWLVDVYGVAIDLRAKQTFTTQRFLKYQIELIIDEEAEKQRTGDKDGERMTSLQQAGKGMTLLQLITTDGDEKDEKEAPKPIVCYQCR
jgi:hypothetical protein